MNFKKDLCIANIYALAKEQSVKIGELETIANISPGYLSRLSKEGNTALPSIDALVAISNKLNVSVDSLVKKDFTLQGPTEIYLLKVLDKLFEDTENDPDIWIAESKEALTKMKRKQIDKHPLFYSESWFSEDVGEELYQANYKSIFPAESRVVVNGDFFYADVSEYAGFYLTSVMYPDGKNAYELFLRDGKKIDPLCTSYRAGLSLAERLELLYKNVDDIVKKPKMKKRVKDTLDNYISGLFDIF